MTVSLRKKLAALVLAGVMAIFFTACGKDVPVSTSSGETSSEAAPYTTIPANSVLDVNYYSGEESFMAGTAFCANLDFWEEPVMITAFHIFGLDSGAEVEDSIDGADVYDTFSDTGAEPIASIVYNATPDDAEAVPKVSKDVAAFLLDDTSGIHAYNLASSDVEKGDTVFLLANLTASDEVTDNSIYPAVVTKTGSGTFDYTLDEKYGLQGASGAPIVNASGGVVGIHIGSNGSNRVAHSANSIRQQLKFTFDKYGDDFRGGTDK